MPNSDVISYSVLKVLYSFQLVWSKCKVKFVVVFRMVKVAMKVMKGKFAMKAMKAMKVKSEGKDDEEVPKAMKAMKVKGEGKEVPKAMKAMKAMKLTRDQDLDAAVEAINNYDPEADEDDSHVCAHFI